MWNGCLYIYVCVVVEGIIDVVKYFFKLFDLKELFVIEKVFNKELEKEIINIVKMVKKNKIDFIGFGDMIYRKYLK